MTDLLNGVDDTASIHKAIHFVKHHLIALPIPDRVHHTLIAAPLATLVLAPPDSLGCNLAGSVASVHGVPASAAGGAGPHGAAATAAAAAAVGAEELQVVGVAVGASVERWVVLAVDQLGSIDPAAETHGSEVLVECLVARELGQIC